MSSTQLLKIQFLDTMNRKNGLFADLGQFFLDEKVTTDRELKEILHRPTNSQAQDFYLILKKGEETMLMVDMEWTLLPAEYMKLIIVTHNGVKEFVWAS